MQIPNNAGTMQFLFCSLYKNMFVLTPPGTCSVLNKNNSSKLLTNR